MTYSGQGEQVFGVGFSADGKLVFTAGGDKKIHAWNPDDGAKKGEIAGFGREVLGLADHGTTRSSVARPTRPCSSTASRAQAIQILPRPHRRRV